MNGALRIPEKHQDKRDGDQQQQDNEIIHILPLIVVGELCRDCHRYLPRRKDDRVEIGIKLAADILRTEKRADHQDDFQHGKPFQETDKETTDNDDIHLVHLRTNKAQYNLQKQVDQQDRLGCYHRADLGDKRVGDCHACRCRIVGHTDILAQYAERSRNFGDIPRISSVDEDDRQHDDEGRDNPKPPGNPGAYRDIQ